MDIIFAGDKVLGYPDLRSLTAGQLKNRGFTLGMTEHLLQLQFSKRRPYGFGCHHSLLRRSIC
ncbi:hypothetical protein [Sporomusa sphaeroides]|uniref:hypothetical protein n=1 Tax=Sporomusa sphaeroides TaxID=47679 RepID=UPI002B7EBC9D|nr:hypothetical protein [Sporomusa sphaeroides]HML35180.1 hypothetical protein [Sporomusa sphaeroides]